MLDEAYDHRTWHGTNLRGSIRGVTAQEASWRPRPRRHNIWEEVVHASYWKYAVRRRLTGEKRGSFGLKGSNWFARPAAGSGGEGDWRGDVARLDHEHRLLRATVAGLSPSGLHVRTPGRKTSPFDLILGVAYHDIYHAGQIQLLKRLQRR